MIERKKIAIVGSGISGMVAAYQLYREHEITLFEAGDYIGGHTHTVNVEKGGKTFAVDTGFIVCNDETYPNFMTLMGRLGVELQNTSMSFSVKCEESGLEYGTQSLTGLFLAHGNMFRPSIHNMLREMLRFNRNAKAFLQAPQQHLSFADFLSKGQYSKNFVDHYLVPMLASVWSAAPSDTGNMPALAFLRFFLNHGLLNVLHRPQWKVVKGGSREYVKKLVAPYQKQIRLNTPVRKIIRHTDGVRIFTDNGEEHFDEVILAVHSDTALKLLGDVNSLEWEILRAIPYQKNEVILHTDASLLPQKRSCWSSWNYRLPKEEASRATLTYNMNLLQGFDCTETFCVSLNERVAIRPECIIDCFHYDHPLFTQAGIVAQARHGEISGKNRTHFCGAYWGNGFHEDGVNSALAVCAAFGRGRI